MDELVTPEKVVDLPALIDALLCIRKRQEKSVVVVRRFLHIVPTMPIR